MNKRIAAVLAAAISIVVLNGCSPTCEEVCNQAVTLCEREIREGRSTVETEREACQASCKGHEESGTSCTNLDEIKDCVMDADECTKVGECPQCAQ